MLADQLRLLQHRPGRFLLLVGRLSVPFNYVLYDAPDLSWYLLPDRLVDDQVAFNLDLYMPELPRGLSLELYGKVGGILFHG